MTDLILCRTVADYRAECERQRRLRGPLGLVPTMGALHEGHLALVGEAKRHAGSVAVTIFVNPTQFAPHEDLDRYPRDLAGDLDKCRGAGVSLVFAPDSQEMYPPNEQTRVRVAALAEHLCGAARPTHFAGVATIVTKLFAATGPCVAVFGRKDYQQLKVIERLARDLLLPVKIVGCPTVREADGLARSSRNAYLSDDERRRARAIPRALALAVDRVDGGERSVGVLRQLVASTLEHAGIRVDYVVIADADEIAPFADAARMPERALLAVAGFVGSTRLIDNVVFSEDGPPPALAES